MPGDSETQRNEKPRRGTRRWKGLPKPLRIAAGPLLGALAGLPGGPVGVFIGLLLGYLLEEIFRQSGSDRKAAAYFEDPGPVNFYEGEPGLAAFCGLGVLILSQSLGETRSSGAAGEVITREVGDLVDEVFPSSGTLQSLAGHFSGMAFSRRSGLNPYLLAESLAARRASGGDLPLLGRALYGLASGEEALETARAVRRTLDPLWQPGAREDEGFLQAEDDLHSWQVLGLPPGTPLGEVKSHFRKLAIRYHPDSLQGLGEAEQKAAAESFIAIKEAYARISSRGKRPSTDS